MNITRLREATRHGAVDPFVAALYHGDSSSSPPAPDYTGAAREQSQASKEIATGQTFANRPQLNTPWGQMTWSTAAGTDPATGQPITNWTGNLNLTKGQQEALDAQERIQAGRSTAAEQLLGHATAATAKPMDWSQLPERAQLNAGKLDTSAPTQTTFGTNEAAFGGERQRIEQALFDKMRPEHERQTAGVQTRLANMGLSPGSEAYNREMERLQGVQAGERFNALQMGGAEQQRMNQMLLAQNQQAFGQDTASQQAQNEATKGQFGMDATAANFQNQNRTAAIAEEMQKRGQPLSELNALLTGTQVQMPGMPQFQAASAGNAPNLLGAAQSQGQYGLDAAKGGSDTGALIGGVASVAAAFL